MTTYELIIATLGVVNLALALFNFSAARAKASGERLDAMEKSITERFGKLNQSVSDLKTVAESAITHDHLADVYADIKDIAGKLHVLVGQNTQMHASLQLLLNQQLRNH